MAIKAALWVHGTVVEAEQDLAPMSRRGWGTHFTVYGSVTQYWFHIPMPTPVILDDRRPILARVFVFYRTTDVKLAAIHFYDGPRKFKEFDDLDLQGDHSRAINASNTWEIDPPLEIMYGLGISVRAQVLYPHLQGEILFTTAGADFL